MTEAPEALLLSGQMNREIKGKRITEVYPLHTPHKFAWFYGDPQAYGAQMIGKIMGETRAIGGFTETDLEDCTLLLGEGVNLRYFAPGEKLPATHQLLIGFEDDSALVVSVRMYGAIMCIPKGVPMEGGFLPYCEGARNKPQVMSDAFTLPYFLSLIQKPEKQEKSAKAFLATEQTIPGLGNGVLQDMLYNARIHPKTKVKMLTDAQRENLYAVLKSTLAEMYRLGGRSTETDLNGRKGGYIPFLSAATVGSSCTRCGGEIRKENYMGGSIYYCSGCQVISL